MSTIAGNEKENNTTTPPVSAEGGRKYNGCGWDGCYDDDGYDDEEMEAFIPAQLRSIADSCCNQCPEYDSCGKMREA